MHCPYWAQILFQRDWFFLISVCSRCCNHSQNSLWLENTVLFFPLFPYLGFGPISEYSRLDIILCNHPCVYFPSSVKYLSVWKLLPCMLCMAWHMNQHSTPSIFCTQIIMILLMILTTGSFIAITQIDKTVFCVVDKRMATGRQTRRGGISVQFRSWLRAPIADKSATLKS